jgi:hypothetical protein
MVAGAARDTYLEISFRGRVGALGSMTFSFFLVLQYGVWIGE